MKLTFWTLSLYSANTIEMKIDRNTRISKLINHNPAALDAIVGISPRFEKLRNPALRKLMASRTSIAMAARVGGCTVDDFYLALGPLGFSVDHSAAEKHMVYADPKPDFINNLSPDHIVTLDVRPVLEKGEDPFDTIIEQVGKITNGHVLKIINTFEPVPLITHLKKQGFDASVDHINDQEVITWFYKAGHVPGENDPKTEKPEVKTEDWEEIMVLYRDKLREIDVRDLEMPAPMITILETLDAMSSEEALFVYHKRIPLFLLPELQQRQLDYRIKEVSENEVHLIIFQS